MGAGMAQFFGDSSPALVLYWGVGFMTNSRQAGKRWERYFVKRLKFLLPDLRRNANEHSANGGVDLIS